MLYVPFAILVAALLFGVPIAFSLTLAGAFGLWITLGDAGQVVEVVGTTVFSSVADYTLSTVPLFILMAFLASQSGVARELFSALSSWTSNIRGGLAVATVGATGMFGALSGASTAAAAVMSQVAVPNMRRHGYADEVAAGAVAVGATTAILIPPSIALVIYGLMTETSLGDLLIAGILPGVLLAVLLAATILIWVRINPALAPETYPSSWGERVSSLRGVWPSATLILLMLSLLYSGIATPTEVGAIGAVSAMALGFALRRLTWEGVIVAVHQTLRASAMIFLIFVAAKIFGYYLSLSQIPQMLVTWVGHLAVNRWFIIIGIIVGYFVLSMFMDELPLMVITLPLTFPIIVSLGFDPVWFGVLTMMMIAMGLVFPPVGMVAFVVSASGGVALSKVYKGTLFLILSIFAATALLMVFPEIALYLPALVRGREF